MKSRYLKLVVTTLAFCWVFSYLNLPGMILLLDLGMECGHCHDVSFIYKKGHLQLVLAHTSHRNKDKSHGKTHKPMSPSIIAGDSNSHVFPILLTNHYKLKDNNGKLIYYASLFQPVAWDKSRKFVNRAYHPDRSPPCLSNLGLSSTTILLI